MIKNIKGDFENFVKELEEAVKEGYTHDGNVSASGWGLGPKTRMASYDILTKECGKTYVARGLSGMVAIVTELASEGRKIRSVTPVSIYKERLLSAEYLMVLRKEEPKKWVSEDEAKVVTAGEGELTYSGKNQWENFCKLMADYRAENPISDDKPTDDEGITVKEPVDLMKLSKKELVAMCKERGLSGNIQETKKVLVERLEADNG